MNYDFLFLLIYLNLIIIVPFLFFAVLGAIWSYTIDIVDRVLSRLSYRMKQRSLKNKSTHELMTTRDKLAAELGGEINDSEVENYNDIDRELISRGMPEGEYEFIFCSGVDVKEVDYANSYSNWTHVQYREETPWSHWTKQKKQKRSNELPKIDESEQVNS